MKLLLDENISHRITKHLLKQFPGSKHVFDISDTRLSDTEIWEYAKKDHFIIVTYDEDFYEWSLIRSQPPKIVWLRFGNAINQIIIKKLLDNHNAILKLGEDKELGLLEIH